jgi:hypothetical protein
MAQRLFAAGQDGLVVARLQEDHPFGRQPGLEQGRGEEIRTGDAPQNLAKRARGQARREQGGGGAIDGAGPAAGDLMQGAELEPAVGQSSIQLGDPERQDPLAHAAASLDLGDLGAQRLEGAVGRVCEHGLRNGRGLFMFLICSPSNRKESSAPHGILCAKP